MEPERFSLRIEDIPRITQVIPKELLQSELNERSLSSLGVELCSDVKNLKEWKAGLKSKKLSVRKALSNILQNWIEENEGKASLEQLLEVFKSEGLTNVAEKCERLFVKFALHKKSGDYSLLPSMTEEPESVQPSVTPSVTTTVWFPKILEDLLSKLSLQDQQEFRQNLSTSPSTEIFSKKIVEELLSKLSLNEQKKFQPVLELLWSNPPSPSSEAQERALGKKKILEKIFGKLELRDQKVFRQVCRGWLSKTFEVWRKTAPIKILNQTYFELDQNSQPSGVTFQEFVWLLQNEQDAIKNDEEESSKLNPPDLLNHPFHRYAISYYTNNNLVRPLVFASKKREEKRFWKECGAHVELLRLCDVLFTEEGTPGSFKNVVRRLLLDVCPKLGELEIEESCWDLAKEDDEPGIETNQGKIEETSNFKEYSEIQALHLHVGLRGEDLKEIFKLCPNLQILTIQSDEDLEGLLEPKIKLKILTIEPWLKWRESIYLPLRKYVEASPTISHLNLHSVVLEHARQSPFNLYAALAQCPQLKSLELNLKKTRNGENETNWLMDLSNFYFPKLTELKITFQTQEPVTNEGSMGRASGHLKFDFGTLKGMPQLELLFLQIFDVDEEERKDGREITADWVYQGLRNHYIPKGISSDYFYSEEEPILCNYLKDFSFYGWSLTQEDVQLLSEWFPNLNKLSAAVKPEALAILLDYWKDLDKLYIKSKEFISLRKLSIEKERKKSLEIVTRIDKTEQLVEVKEHEGVYYFEEKEKEPEVLAGAPEGSEDEELSECESDDFDDDN